MALRATQISRIHCRKEHTMKRWQTSATWGTGASSGVTRSRDPLPGDEDFGSREGRETCPGPGGSARTAEEPRSARREVEGLGRARGIAVRGRGGSACLWMPSLMGVSEGGRAGDVPAAQGGGELSRSRRVKERKQRDARGKSFG